MSLLCYHSVDSSWNSPLAVRDVDFDRQCRWITRHRSALPLDMALERLQKDGTLPHGALHLTFDDGFEALHQRMLPVLRRYRLPSSVFLVAQTLTPQGRAVDWVDRPPLTPLATLSLDQVLEMQDSGVDFQSHSWAHHDLTTLDYDSCRHDLNSSRELLEDLLGKRVTVLAYPRGRHDRMVREAAKAAGYTHALALPEHREDVNAFAIPRVGIYRANGARIFRLKVSPRYLKVRHSGVVRQLRSFRHRP